METLEKLLQEHQFLTGLSREQVRFLTGCARNVRFGAGEYLIREGSAADTLFLIREGLVRLEVEVPGRGTMLVESVGKGDILGLSWLFEPYRWYLDARAAEGVRAFAFDAACLRARMEEDHDLGYAVAKRLLRQIYLRLERVRMQRLDVFGAEAGSR